MANGAGVKKQALLIPSGNPPQDFEKLSVQAKVDILSSVAESSYKILLRVPETGLRDSHNAIKQIITTRKWLEETNDVAARVLAMAMQYGVDSCIFNAMYRKEKQKHNRPLKRVFKKDSFDNAMASKLLNQNKINEREYVSYALDLDTKVANFCRKNNYKPDDFLTGKVFEEASSQMKISLSATKNGKEIKLLENADIRDISLLGTITWTGYKIKSTKELDKFVFPMVLNNIDEARNVRLLAHTYIKYGGFANSIEPDVKLVWSQQLEIRVSTEWSNRKERRLTSHSRQPAAKQDANIALSKISKRVDTYEENGYAKNLNLKFVPFIRKKEIFPREFAKVAGKMGLVGMWLNLAD